MFCYLLFWACLACVFALYIQKTGFFSAIVAASAHAAAAVAQEENFSFFFSRVTMEKVFNILKLCFVVMYGTFFCLLSVDSESTQHHQWIHKHTQTMRAKHIDSLLA